MVRTRHGAERTCSTRHTEAATELLEHLSVDPPAPITHLRVAVVTAHPDDEVVGAGSRLPAFEDLVLVQVTDGSPRSLADAKAAGFPDREDYAAARRAERACALAHAGHADSAVVDLGIVDQEASLDLAQLARRLTRIIGELRPDVILTHPYEGGHPDHDATAFGVHAATRLITATHDVARAPAIVEMASYHERDGAMRHGAFPDDGAGPEVIVSLGEQSRWLKQCMYDCYVTQRRVLDGFPIGVECFRVAPRYNFSEPPLGSALYYERFDWGMRGERWRSLASDALVELGLDAA